MVVLSEHDVFIFVAQLGIIILAARVFAEIAQRFGQPGIVGEVLAGIVLGPSIFGKFFPNAYTGLFPQDGIHPYLLQGLSWLCVFLLLVITGLEIDFRASLKHGKSSIGISLLTLGFSLIGVYLLTPALPDFLYTDPTDRFHTNLLLALSLAVVAIPVIAKILLDLQILKSEVGVKILTSGVLSDVWGWVLLALFTTLISSGTITFLAVIQPLVTMVLYLVLTLFFGQKIVDKIFDIIGYKKMDTTVVLSLLFSLALINGAIAHLLGIHVIFGAFIAGIMAGESDKITPYMRQWIQDFILAIFAPIFFVLIGMQLHFSNASAWWPIFILLVSSTLLKIGGAYLGAIASGIGQKNALAVACGLNTQGTMGIIVGLIAYEMGVFNDDMFFVVVVICVLTSLLVGPLLKWAVMGVKRPLAEFFTKDHIFLDVEANSKLSAIKAITKLMAQRKLISDDRAVARAILEREDTLSTAIGDGVAVPHARIPNFKKPILCFFRLREPIDYGSPDNIPVQLLFLELTDSDDDGMQLDLITQVARFISSVSNRERLIHCTNEQEIHHIMSFDETV